MNGILLLATSKSLVNVRDKNSPYRYTGNGRLPTFGFTKNPFTTPAALPGNMDCSGSRGCEEPLVRPQIPSSESLPLFDEELKPAVNRLAMVKPAQIVAESEGEVSAVPGEPKSPELPYRAPAVECSRALPATECAGIRERVDFQEPDKVTHEGSSGGGVVSALFALSRLGRTRQPASRKVVQGELCLQNVTVKRNRLRDADVKVVGHDAEVQTPARALPAYRPVVAPARETAGFGAAMLRFLSLGQIKT